MWGTSLWSVASPPELFSNKSHARSPGASFESCLKRLLRKSGSKQIIIFFLFVLFSLRRFVVVKSSFVESFVPIQFPRIDHILVRSSSSLLTISLIEPDVISYVCVCMCVFAYGHIGCEATPKPCTQTNRDCLPKNTCCHQSLSLTCLTSGQIRTASLATNILNLFDLSNVPSIV